MKTTSLKVSSDLIYLASLFNLLWLSGSIINPSIDWVNQLASFYASACEPYHLFFMIIDIGLFLSVIGWIYLSYKKYSKILIFSMFSVAISTLGDAFFPPRCLSYNNVHPTLLKELTNIHVYTSAFGFFAIFISTSYIALRLYRIGFSKIVVAGLYIFNLILLFQYNYKIVLGSNSYVGLVQRILILLFSIWLVLIPKVSSEKTI